MEPRKMAKSMSTLHQNPNPLRSDLLLALRPQEGTPTPLLQPHKPREGARLALVASRHQQDLREEEDQPDPQLLRHQHEGEASLILLPVAVCLQWAGHRVLLPLLQKATKTRKQRARTTAENIFVGTILLSHM